MALARILIDGYSLLHSWVELAPGKPRYSSAARDELIQVLTRYQDLVRTPITIIFDGAGAPPGVSRPVSTPEMEILYSKPGQTADEMIERAAHRLAAYGEVLVVTNDLAEQETIASVGGLTSSCDNFIRTILMAFDEMTTDLKHHNRKELSKFRRS